MRGSGIFKSGSDPGLRSGQRSAVGGRAAAVPPVAAIVGEDQPVVERERRRQEEELGPEDGWEVEGGRVLKGGPEEPSKDPEAEAARLTQEAAWYSFAGNQSASTYANLAVDVFPSSAPARLVRVCWYMQEDAWRFVRKELSDPTIRDTPEARLLSDFIERLPRSPDRQPAPCRRPSW